MGVVQMGLVQMKLVQMEVVHLGVGVCDGHREMHRLHDVLQFFLNIVKKSHR